MSLSDLSDWVFTNGSYAAQATDFLLFLNAMWAMHIPNMTVAAIAAIATIPREIFIAHV
jgi:hypothetical protein